MTVDEIVTTVEALGGVLTLRPQPGDGSPEIAWGDVFFYYAPDGQVPPGQPFATVVTKGYPDEDAAYLDAPGAFRLNVAVGAHAVAAVAEPYAAAGTPDTWTPHPVYGHLGWVAVVNPGERTSPRARDLLGAAHAAARARHERRAAAGAAAQD